MPPIPSNLQIQSLYQGIVNKFGGRTNFGPAASSVALYVTAAQQAIQELTETIEFEELKTISPIVSLSYGVGTYSISQFIPSGQLTWDLTDIYDWGYWLTPGSQVGPFRIIKYRRIPTVDMYQFGTTAPAPPVYFSRFGSPWGISGAGSELVLGPIPDNNYFSFMRFKSRHPFTSTIYDSPIYVPDSWQEILEYATCLRLAINEGSEKYVTIFRTMLFGDPRDPTNVGLLNSRKKQMERDANHNEWQISVTVNTYSYGGQ
jgi:hypothetical protein